MSKPIVAVVGHPNVGKSTLFNRIVGTRLSIVDDVPGVTRDRIYSNATWLNNKFSIIDTGGINIGNEPLLFQIEQQAQIAINEADVILFVTNVLEGVTEADEYIAKILYKSLKPVILVVNKVDNLERKSNIYDFYSLGLGDPHPISSTHGIGVGDLLDDVVKLFPSVSNDESKDSIKFSLIGRPNVGKSSIVNAVLGENREIVSEIQGTTRDATDTDFIFNGKLFTIIDTAGMYKKGKLYENAIRYSFIRSLAAIKRSNVVLVVLNAEEGIREEDKRIAGYAHNDGKGIILIVNKWDKINKNSSTMNNFQKYVYSQLQYLTYAPILFTSAINKKNLNKLPNLIEKINDNHNRRIQSSILNDVLSDAIMINPPPAINGKKLHIYYITQVSTAPPTFVVFVNDIKLLHFSYQRFLINQLRNNFDFEGTPIKLIIRKKS